jgi:site-specific recombinase XerD
MDEIIGRFEVYLKANSLCVLTIRGYTFDVAQFIEWSEVNGILLNLVTPENAVQYLDYLVASHHEIRPGIIGTYSSRTIMKKITAVRSFFEFLRVDNE